MLWNARRQWMRLCAKWNTGRINWRRETVRGKVTWCFGQTVHPPHVTAPRGDELTDVEYLQAEDELMDIKSNSLEEIICWTWIQAVLACERTGRRSKTCSSRNHQIHLAFCHNIPVRDCFQRFGHRQNKGLMCTMTSVWLSPKSNLTSYHWLKKWRLRALIKSQAAWTIKTCVWQWN